MHAWNLTPTEAIALQRKLREEVRLTPLASEPAFVSPGHLITLEDSLRLVMQCVRKHRLPEPTRAAHNTMNEYRLKDLAS